MEMPLVSVVIPCYNQAHFLREAVDSVLESGYDNVEIIVINDGSTSDEQVKVLYEFNAPKTRVIHQENMGLPSARNSAVAAANGKYILTLDCDDKSARGFISKAVSIMEADSNICLVSGSTEVFGACRTKRLKQTPYKGLSSILRRNCFLSSSLFRRSAWEQVGGFSPQMRYGVEDWDFWISLVELGQEKVDTAVQIPDLSLHYRIHNSSMFRDLSGDKHKNNLMMTLIIKRHIDSFMKYPDALRDFVLKGYKLPDTARSPISMVRHGKRYRRIAIFTILIVMFLLGLLFYSLV